VPRADGLILLLLQGLPQHSLLRPSDYLDSCSDSPQRVVAVGCLNGLSFLTLGIPTYAPVLIISACWSTGLVRTYVGYSSTVVSRDRSASMHESRGCRKISFRALNLLSESHE
jgi:hypothetical protein